MNLNKEQNQGVHHFDGPMLVLAGPGSGKTSVITHRIQYLTEERKIAPSSILVCTFTRAAAAEMRERYLKLIGRDVTAVHFGTLHGTCYGILKAVYGIGPDNIISEGERRGLLKELAERHIPDLNDLGESVEILEKEISLLKNDRIGPSHFYSAACAAEDFFAIWKDYKEEMKARRKLDFDDLQTYCYGLLARKSDLLDQWQRQYTYILVDEFQDINLLQYSILKLLAGPENNLFVVGDDDQSIYRFRGARPEILLNFQKDFPSAGRLILKENYRCSGNVVRASQAMIRKNTKRFDKDLKTENPQGAAVDIRIFSSVPDENMHLAKEIRHLLANGEQAENIAVLFRTNTGSRRVLSKLMEYNIPFISRDAIPGIFDHWMAKQVLAYLRLARGSRQRSDFLMIMNRPNRYISREAVYDARVNFEHLYAFYEDRPWMVERLEGLELDLKRMGGMAPYGAINYLRCSVGYDQYLRDYALERRIKVEELTDLMDEIQETSKGYATFEEWCSYIQEFELALKKQGQERNANGSGVVLSTLHSAKGLEFSHVFIIDVNEGIIPYKKAVSLEEEEEERRLFYVGMTRAKENLHLFSVKSYGEKKSQPSRFLEDLTV